MNFYELLVPKMGEGIVEVYINKWYKEVEEKILKDESLVEISTDKVDSEILSPVNCILKKIITLEGQKVKVGEPFLIIEAILSKDILRSNPNIRKISDIRIKSNEKPKFSLEKDRFNPTYKQFKNTKTIYSPLINTIARKNNISSEELNFIYGSRQNGKINKTDILKYIEKKTKKTYYENSIIQDSLDQFMEKGDKIIKLDRNRLLTAEKMNESNKNIPKVTSFLEADITNIVNWRNSIKEEFLQKHKISITFTPIFLWAIAKSLEKYKILNAYFLENQIIQKKDINIGLAVLVGENNLVMPVIRRANELSFMDLVIKTRELSQNAKKKKLSPNATLGSTYSVSNIGIFNTIMGTPMIMPPQVAILAIGAIKKTIDFDNSENKIKEKHKIIFSHSYDHRVIDGAIGGLFLKKVEEHLNSFIKDIKKENSFF